MLTQKIESVISRLKFSLTADEENAGWTVQSKEGYVPYFEELKTSIRDGKDIPYSALARSLDAYGVGSGDLYDKMMEIANEVNANAR